MPCGGKNVGYGGFWMYKLLLVSDREDVLNAFAQIENWERHGFKPPHIRHDFEGMLDSLAKHHADGIAIEVIPDEAKRYIRTCRRTIRMFRFLRLGPRLRRFCVI